MSSYSVLIKKMSVLQVADFLNFPPNLNVEYLLCWVVGRVVGATTLTTRVITKYNFNDPKRFFAYASG